MNKFKRIFICVCDSVGIGYDETSYKYGDFGANTLKNIAMAVKDIKLPTLESMGIGNIIDLENIKKVDKPTAYYGKMQEMSSGKDTTTGHWEMMGIYTKNPFLTFTDNGFPIELIKEIEEKTGHKIIGNYAASGTEIIKDLGEEHIKTGAMIVYTSADSVLQIAAHELHFGLEELYRVCKIVREICMKPEYQVVRIIARPFLGETKEEFTRTSNRHDFSVSPTEKTVLDNLKDAGYTVIGLGKIADIFNNSGITESYRQKDNHEGMQNFTEIAKKYDFTGLCFLNLVDFDASYGHRRNVEGYRAALEEFDEDLSSFIKNLSEDDLLIITADHGNDPTWKGTDHTREYVPLLIYSKKFKNGGAELPIIKTFSAVGATAAENFGIIRPIIGESLLKELI